MFRFREYIAECLESVLQLGDKDYEVIIIDDGSTDGSGEIVEEFLVDHRFHLYKKENSGPADSRNIGLDKSTGKYITFLDSDDHYLKPDSLFEIIRRMEQKNCQMACFGFTKDNGKNSREAKYTCAKASDVAVRFLSDEVVTKNGVCFPNGIGITLWNKIFERRLFEGNRFPEGVFLMDDFKVCFEAVAKAERVLLCSEIVYFYRKHIGSITLSKFSEKDYELATVPRAEMPNVEERYGKKAELVRPGYAVIYLAFINRLYNSGNRDLKYEEELKEYIRKNIKILIKTKEISLFHKMMLLGYGLLPGLYRLVMQKAFIWVMKIRYR